MGIRTDKSAVDNLIFALAKLKNMDHFSAAPADYLESERRYTRALQLVEYLCAQKSKVNPAQISTAETVTFKVPL